MVRRRRSITIAAFLALLLSSCRPPPPPPPLPLTPLPQALAVESPPIGPLFRYEVSLLSSGPELQVEALFPEKTPAELTVDEGAERFVTDVEVAVGESWQRLRPQQQVFTVPSCPEHGCRLRYRFKLDAAARHFDDPDEVMESGGTYLASPSDWLLRPDDELSGVRARLHVTTPKGQRFVTGLSPAKSGSRELEDTYEVDTQDLEGAPYSGFGAFQTLHAVVAGSPLEMAIVPAAFERSPHELLQWAERTAKMVGAYFGRFPVRRLALFIVPRRGSGVGFGSTMGHGGAAIVVYVGREVSAAELSEDWVLRHEMFHLGMSSQPRRFRWLKEGSATYVEPIIAARAGVQTPEQVWSSFVAQMADGLPGWRDQGIDNTLTWGRLYWGGALFCLLADVEIRERTQNKKSIDDAFRSIVRAGGSIESHWTLEELLQEGDRGTGLSVLTELHHKWADHPVAVDLPALWQRLGVIREGDSVRFDDRAELAAIRRAITAPMPPSAK